MSWEVVSAASYENAEDLTLIKDFMKVSDTADDDLITFFIKSAARMIERYTRHYLLTQTHALYLDVPKNFGVYGTPWFNGVREGVELTNLGGLDYIELDRGPVQSISALNYYSTDNTENTLGTEYYRLDSASSPARVILNEGYSWPSSVRDRDSFKISAVLGYGADQDSLPEDLRGALRAQIMFLYDNRGCGEMKLSAGVKEMLQPFTYWKY